MGVVAAFDALFGRGQFDRLVGRARAVHNAGVGIDVASSSLAIRVLVAFDAKAGHAFVGARGALGVHGAACAITAGRRSKSANLADDERLAAAFVRASLASRAVGGTNLLVAHFHAAQTRVAVGVLHAFIAHGFDVGADRRIGLQIAFLSRAATSRRATAAVKTGQYAIFLGIFGIRTGVVAFVTRRAICRPCTLFAAELARQQRNALIGGVLAVSVGAARAAGKIFGRWARVGRWAVVDRNWRVRSRRHVRHRIAAVGAYAVADRICRASIGLCQRYALKQLAFFAILALLACGVVALLGCAQQRAGIAILPRIAIVVGFARRTAAGA